MRANYETTVGNRSNKERTMKMTTSTLIRLSSIAAMVAGALFVIVGLIHPPARASAVTSPEWAITHGLATAMCFFVLPGLAGIYARQVEESGWLGLAGFLLYSLSWVLTAPFTFAEVLILPVLATEAPTSVEGFLTIFGAGGATSFGALASLWSITGLLYIFGGVLLGIAMLRAGVLSRWAAGLLALGSALAPVAALLPAEHGPKIAVPVGLALAWLGYSLWSEQSKQAPQSVSESGVPQLRHTGAE